MACITDFKQVIFQLYWLKISHIVFHVSENVVLEYANQVLFGGMWTLGWGMMGNFFLHKIKLACFSLMLDLYSSLYNKLEEWLGLGISFVGTKF